MPECLVGTGELPESGVSLGEIRKYIALLADFSNEGFKDIASILESSQLKQHDGVQTTGATLIGIYLRQSSRRFENFSCESVFERLSD